GYGFNLNGADEAVAVSVGDVVADDATVEVKAVAGAGVAVDGVRFGDDVAGDADAKAIVVGGISADKNRGGGVLAVAAASLDAVAVVEDQVTRDGAAEGGQVDASDAMVVDLVVGDDEVGGIVDLDALIVVVDL